MITSNINDILLASQVNNKIENSNNEVFIDTLIDSDNYDNIKRNSDLTFENIKGITLNEIEELFDTDEDKQMAENLRLATLFTDDVYLGKALFNTVSGQPFNLGYSYLFDIYEDKNSFLSSSNDSLSDLLHDTIVNRADEELKPNEKISQSKLDQVLTAVNSFNFVDMLSSTYKDQDDKYKDDDQYSFLYSDYNLKFQELKYKYNELKDIDSALLKQF